MSSFMAMSISLSFIAIPLAQLPNNLHDTPYSLSIAEIL
jgi:hypothetical protein